MRPTLRGAQEPPSAVLTSRKLAGAGGSFGAEVVFKQLVDDDLGCASYLIGDEAAGEAVVVDPAYAIEPYLEAAEDAGLRIVRVIETHTHADHVSGHGRFALEYGLPVAIHPLAEPEYPSGPIEDGDEVLVGSIPIRVLHTPGHRPEHCCFLVEGHLLTGDSLLVGDAARPDLAVEAREGAEDLFRSLERLAGLPDETEIDPGHTGGSLCGASLSRERVSTLRMEKLSNHALAIEDVQEFVAHSTGIAAPRPPTVERVVDLNRGPFLAAQPPLELLDSVQGQLLDVRPAREHAAGHAHGAINIPLEGGSVGTKAGFVLDHATPVTIHARSPEEAADAARRLYAVGLLDVAGYAMGLESSEHLEPVGIDELERLVAADSVEVVDVREKDERDEGYIPGSRHIPYRLIRAFRDELDNGRPVVTVCSSGARAGVAASVLAAEGVDARPVLDGGIDNWQERGNQVTAFRRCGSG